MTNISHTHHRAPARRQTVPWQEFQLLLDRAVETTFASVTQVMRTIGYSDSVCAAWRNNDAAPLCAKYSLLGLLAELSTTDAAIEQAVEVKLTAIARPFSYSDLISILSALARSPDPDRALIALVAKQIAEYS